MSENRANVVSIDAGHHRASVLSRRDELVTENLELVRSIARNLHASLPSSFELDDLIQTGNVALIRAATSYRPREHGGAPFSAYARPVIRGAILDSVRRRHYSEATRPGLEEVREPASEPLVDALIDEMKSRRAMREALALLQPVERKVVEMYYSGQDRPRHERTTFAAIGKVLSISRTSAQKIHQTALAKLRIRRFQIQRDAA